MLQDFMQFDGTFCFHSVTRKKYQIECTITTWNQEDGENVVSFYSLKPSLIVTSFYS